MESSMPAPCAIMHLYLKSLLHMQLYVRQRLPPAPVPFFLNHPNLAPILSSPHAFQPGRALQGASQQTVTGLGSGQSGGGASAGRSGRRAGSGSVASVSGGSAAAGGVSGTAGGGIGVAQCQRERGRDSARGHVGVPVVDFLGNSPAVLRSAMETGLSREGVHAFRTLSNILGVQEGVMLRKAATRLSESNTGPILNTQTVARKRRPGADKRRRQDVMRPPLAPTRVVSARSDRLCALLVYFLVIGTLLPRRRFWFRSPAPGHRYLTRTTPRRCRW